MVMNCAGCSIVGFFPNEIFHYSTCYMWERTSDGRAASLDFTEGTYVSSILGFPVIRELRDQKCVCFKNLRFLMLLSRYGWCHWTRAVLDDYFPGLHV